MQADPGPYKLSSDEYAIRRRRAYIGSYPILKKKEDIDLDDFSVAQVDVLMERLDLLKERFPQIDVIVTIEVSIEYDRKAIERARREAQVPSVTSQTPVPTQARPPTPSESTSRGRAPMLSSELQSRLDGEEYRRQELRSHYSSMDLHEYFLRESPQGLLG